MNLVTMLGHVLDEQVAYESTTSRHDLRRLLDQHRPQNGWRITEAFYIAPGPYSRDGSHRYGDKETRDLVVFLDMVDYCG